MAERVIVKRQDIDAQRVLERAREWMRFQDGFDEGGHSSSCATYDPIQAGDCDCGWEKFVAAIKQYMMDWPNDDLAQ